MERELLLLGLLRHQDMHGYQLHEFIANNMASCTDLTKPTAYHLLDRMEQQGWLTSSEEADGKRPARKIYRITTDGEAAFQRLLRENLSTYSSATFSGSIGVAFLDSLSSAEAVSLLSQRRVALARSLDEMRSAPPHSGSLGLVIEHQVHHLQSELTWLDSVVARLQT